MAFRGEREPGVDMDLEFVESMVQDEIPVQDIPINVQVELPPQINPEPEMGAAAAAVYDTSPPPLRQNPRSLLNRLSRVHPTWPSYAPCWRE